MKIAKLIFLACPAIIVSLLLVANPAHAAETQPQPHASVIQISSTSQIPAPATVHFNRRSNPIQDQAGCSCTQCTLSSQQLQGKLPSFDL